MRMSSPHRIELKVGETLFREGDEPTTAFLVESGRLRISATVGGKAVILGDVETGALVGEVAVLDDAPRTATATALEPSVLTAVDRNQISERIAAADPIVRALLQSQFARYRVAVATLTGKALLPLRIPAAGEDATEAHDKIRLESQLREALASGGLEIHLQPIQDFVTWRIAGYEALVRWTHAERGAISPAEFITLAEETSLIVPIGDFVLREVCRALRSIAVKWPVNTPYIGLNVSGRQIEDPDFVERVAAQVREHSVDPALLRVEVTESLVLDYRKVATFLERCRAAGIRAALDDFGTGYSSLSHLHRLNFDALKLDQAFVHQLDDRRCLAIVRAVITMAAALGCDVVAEGVETRAQLDCLRNLGCRYAQGYLIGKAQSVESVLAASAA
jgi:EAL domain-containing protein (putative c-di-GMP-specific phosphodiesterase class I)